MRLSTQCDAFFRRLASPEGRRGSREAETALAAEGLGADRRMAQAGQFAASWVRPQTGLRPRRVGVEVEASAVKEDCGPEALRIPEATGHSLHVLDLPVHCLAARVRQARDHRVDDAVQVTLDHPADLVKVGKPNAQIVIAAENRPRMATLAAIEIGVD